MTIESNQKLIEKEAELSHYPARSRQAALGLKLLWGAVIGAGILLGSITVAITAPVWVVGGLVIGAAGYSIRTAYKTYQANKTEAALVAKYQEEAEEFEKIINQEIEDSVKWESLLNKLNGLKKLREAIPDYNQNIEKLYSQLHQLNEMIQTHSLYLDAQLVHAKKENNQEKMNALTKTKNKWQSHQIKLNDYLQRSSNLRLDKLAPPITSPSAKDKISSDVEEQGGSRLFTLAKKAGNRFFSFMAGASFIGGIVAGVCMILGVTLTASFLVSNPIGWGILGGLVLGGVAAVGIDYAITNRQKKKIQRLHRANHTMEKKVAAAKLAIATIESISNKVDLYRSEMAHAEVNAELVRLKEKKASDTTANIMKKLPPAQSHETLKEDTDQESSKTFLIDMERAAIKVSEPEKKNHAEEGEGDGEHPNPAHPKP